MAIETGCAEKKETTILNLSWDIEKVLADFQERLDNRFVRGIKGVKESEERPVIPNILDEIIGNLEADRAWLSRIMSFVTTDVLNKIN